MHEFLQGGGQRLVERKKGVALHNFAAAPATPTSPSGVPDDKDRITFTWNVVNDRRCASYNIYRGAVDNAAVAERIDVIPQPGERDRGLETGGAKSRQTIKWTDPTPSSAKKYYWVSAANSVGKESARVAVTGIFFTDGKEKVLSGTILSDFSDTRYWVPFGDSRAATVSVTDAGVQVETTGARDSDMMISCGIMPRFVLFPDESGSLQIRIKVDNLVMPTDDTAGDKGLIGFLLHRNNFNAGLFFGVGLQGTHTNLKVWNGTSDDLGGTVLNALREVEFGGTVTEVQLRVTCQANSGVTPERYGWFPFEYNTGGGWTTLAISTDFHSVGYNTARGLHISLGMFTASRNQNFRGRFTEFELLSGIGVVR